MNDNDIPPVAWRQIDQHKRDWEAFVDRALNMRPPGMALIDPNTYAMAEELRQLRLAVSRASLPAVSRQTPGPRYPATWEGALLIEEPGTWEHGRHSWLLERYERRAVRSIDTHERLLGENGGRYWHVYRPYLESIPPGTPVK